MEENKELEEENEIIKEENKKEKKKKEKIKVLEEFKKFVMKGNVLDMAIGVIIGGAFGKIVTSLVNDILMPSLSLLTGQIDLASLKYEKVISESVSINLNYGMFLQTIVDFLIISLSIFVVIKIIGKLSRKKKEKEEQEVLQLTKEQELLIEIRDILKNK